MAAPQVKVTVSVISHATERQEAIVGAIETLGIESESTKRTNTSGHFGNPIVMLEAHLSGRKAKDALKSLGAALKWDKSDARNEITECISDSTLYVRLDKQELVSGKIVRSTEGAVRVRVSVPLFGKQDPVDTYTNLFSV